MSLDSQNKCPANLKRGSVDKRIGLSKAADCDLLLDE